MWPIEFVFSEELLRLCPIRDVVVAGRDKEVVAKRRQRDQYVVRLKVVSTLENPKIEVDLEEVVEVVSESRVLDVYRNKATLEVQFKKRPRNVFHRHGDVMVLAASLYCGEKQIAEDRQTLIFRGGTGSEHSSKSRKKKAYQAMMQTLKTSSTKKELGNVQDQQLPIGNQQPQVYVPQYHTIPIKIPNSSTRQEIVIPQIQDKMKQNETQLQEEPIPEYEQYPFPLETPQAYIPETPIDDPFLYEFLDPIQNFFNQDFDYQPLDKKQTSQFFDQKNYDPMEKGYLVNDLSVSLRKSLDNKDCYSGTLHGNYHDLPFSLNFSLAAKDSQLVGSFNGSLK